MVKHHPPEDTHDGDYSQIANSSIVPISAGMQTELLFPGDYFSTARGSLPCHPLAVGDSLVLSPGT